MTNPASALIRSATPYQRIMICIHGDHVSAQLVEYAAGWVGPSTVVRVVTTVSKQRGWDQPGRLDGAQPICPSGQSTECLRAAAMHTLDMVAAMFAARGVPAETALLNVAPGESCIAHALDAAARAWGADVLIVGAQPRKGAFSGAGGGRAEPLIRAFTCPLLLLPAAGTGRRRVPPARIFVASDGSDSSRNAIAEAQRIAGCDAVIRVARVYRDEPHSLGVGDHRWSAAEGEPSERGADQDFDHTIQNAPHRMELAALEAARTSYDLPRAIVHAASEWGADLLVLGTHGSSHRVKSKFGSVAEEVVRLAALPLLLIRHRTDHA